MAAVKIPPCIWAERKDKVIFTVNVPGLRQEDCTVELEENGNVSFLCGNVYNLQFTLLKAVDVKKSKWGVAGRGVVFEIFKKEEGWWGKMVKDAKPRWLSCDWNRWMDEDDEVEIPDNLDMGNMGGFNMDDAAEPPEDEEEEDGNDMPSLEADSEPAPEEAPKKPEEEEEKKDEA
ncbi:hypothetical protein Pelo_93 [Pelomyxa schiedti]|nr:hypothetical protein Pelo_93 [Pelomyxa schiedti]